jgi:hypothetical protein
MANTPVTLNSVSFSSVLDFNKGFVLIGSGVGKTRAIFCLPTETHVWYSNTLRCTQLGDVISCYGDCYMADSENVQHEGKILRIDVVGPSDAEPTGAAGWCVVGEDYPTGQNPDGSPTMVPFDKNTPVKITVR